MIVNGAAIRAASAGFQALFQAGWERAKPLWPRFCSYTESTGDSERYLMSGGLPELREWLGDRQRRSLEIFERQVVNRTWELTIPVRRELFEDDRLGVLRSDFEMMGVAARNHPDQLLRDLLVNGFTATGYDGEVFFSTAHDEGDNRVSGALATGTFNTAIRNMREIENSNGKRLDLWAYGGKLVLMVAPNLESTGRGILLAQFGSNGASNMDYGRAELVVNNLLPDGHWFLIMADAAGGPFRFQMRREPTIVAQDQPGDDSVYNRNEVEYGVDGRWNMDYALWQFIQGSDGT